LVEDSTISQSPRPYVSDRDHIYHDLVAVTRLDAVDLPLELFRPVESSLKTLTPASHRLIDRDAGSLRQVRVVIDSTLPRLNGLHVGGPGTRPHDEKTEVALPQALEMTGTPGTRILAS